MVCFLHEWTFLAVQEALRTGQPAGPGCKETGASILTASHIGVCLLDICQKLLVRLGLHQLAVTAQGGHPAHDVLVLQLATQIGQPHQVFSWSDVEANTIWTCEHIPLLNHIYPIGVARGLREEVDFDPFAVRRHLYAVGHSTKGVELSCQAQTPNIVGVDGPVPRRVLHELRFAFPDRILERQETLGGGIVLHPPKTLQTWRALGLSGLQHFLEPVVGIRYMNKIHGAARPAADGARHWRDTTKAATCQRIYEANEDWTELRWVVNCWEFRNLVPVDRCHFWNARATKARH
mmetsp:Transcript_86929/g.243616  ORF Transcript_86929/g.243616 Transcript_86929/m.243616 type:complete len:292 (-) Transcript_86929:76-951(-)